MKFTIALLLVAGVSANWWTYKDASEHPEVQEMLKHYRPYHKKWNYEPSHYRKPLPHLVNGKEVNRQQAVQNAAQAHHKANTTAAFPKNLLYLLRSYSTGAGIPLSYNDQLPTSPPTSYWATQTYLGVGAIDPYGNALALDSAIATQERTLTKYGLNLYDGATWEIGLALWNLHEVAWMFERGTLYISSTGPMGREKGAPGGVIDIRADHTDFKYGDMKISGDALMKFPVVGNQTHFDQLDDGTPAKQPTKEMAGAFYYRIIAPKYQLTDPMLGSYNNDFKIPWPSNDTTTPWNVYGEIHFNDWKPITGENVWSSIIGPLQTLYLATNGNMSNTTCGNPAHTPKVFCDFKTWDTTPSGVQQAISILPAFKALLSQLGSIFHCPWGSKLFPYDANEGTNVSNENNFSAYAALLMLQTVLKNYTAGTADPKLQYATTTVDELVAAMDKWWDNNLMSEKDILPDGARVVPQGGHIVGTTYSPVPVGDFGGLAVDCQTWGMTVLGAKRVDRVYGKRAAFDVWQAAKKWAGYWKADKTIIAGVGYTDLGSANGTVPQNNIWSAEWTFGAINMCQRLAQDYNDMGDAQAFQSLMHDAQSMYNEVTKLWNPENNQDGGLMFPDGSFVYANARFFIPWGWYANPISSLCSTSWSVMQAQNFNPFELGGGNKPPLTPPAHLHDLLYKHQHAIDEY